MEVGMSTENNNESSKVADSLKIDEYNAGAYLSITEFLGYYGQTDTQIQKLSGAKVAKFKDWVKNGNRTVETTLYPFNDQIPLAKSSEAFTYAKTMAMHWAQYEKEADAGSSAAKAKKTLWGMDKESLIGVMKAMPQKSTIRSVESSAFDEDETLLFSQTYGQEGLL